MSPVFDVPTVRTRALVRPRLLNLLGTSSDRPSLSLVYGSAGSGKSTLLSHWADAVPFRDENLAWVSLNPEDAGVLAFWARVGGALIRHGLLPADTSFETPGRPGALLDAFAALDEDLTLVLDDYHLVASEPLDGQLRLLVEKVGRLRLVVGSRTATGLHSVELAARVHTVLIDADALAFTSAESVQLIGDEPLANAIQSATLGWPLATQALLVEARRDPSIGALLSRATDRNSQFITEFVRLQLTARDEESREFLLRIGLTNEVTVPLAIELGAHTAEFTRTQLERLESDGIGTWQMRAGVRWFRLHPLLQEELEQEAVAALPDSTTRSLRGVLSDHLQADRMLRSLELAFAIDDWDRMERLVLLNWTAFSYYYRLQTTELFRRVPRNAMREHPALLAAELVQDFADETVTLERMLSTLAVITSARRNREAQPGVVGALAEIIYMGLYRIFGDIGTALEQADRARAMMSLATTDDRKAHAGSLPAFHAHTAITYLIDAQYVRAIDEIAQTRDLATEVNSLGERFQALAVTALITVLRGDIRGAREWIAHCEAADPQDGWFGGYLQGGYHLAKAIEALNRWDAPAAASALGLYSQREVIIEYWPYIAVSRANADLILHGPAHAHAVLAESILRKQSRPKVADPLRGMVAATEAQLLLLAGQTARANSVIEKAALNGHPSIDLVRARLAIAQGRFELAISLADAVAWSSTESPRLRAEALLTVAAASFEAGQRERSATTFATAMTALYENDLRIPLLTIARERLVELHALALELGHDVDGTIIGEVPVINRPSRRVETLSGAERRVLKAMIDNEDVAAAADALHLSVHTVRYHLKRSYPKLGVTTRAEAIALAQELGLLEG